MTSWSITKAGKEAVKQFDEDPTLHTVTLALTNRQWHAIYEALMQHERDGHEPGQQPWYELAQHVSQASYEVRCHAA